MPYIKQEKRHELSLLFLNDLETKISDIRSSGELNFLITSIVKEYLKYRGIKYDNINEVIGVLECVKLELYRRVAIPYEDQKISENGDVY